MVKWSKIFDHDHCQNPKLPWSNGQNWPFLTMTMAKITKFSWSNGQNWPFLTMTMAKIEGVMVMVNFFDH